MSSPAHHQGGGSKSNAKTKTGKLSPEQAERQKHIEAMGGIYIVARSLDDLEARKPEIIHSRP